MRTRQRVKKIKFWRNAWFIFWVPGGYFLYVCFHQLLAIELSYGVMLSIYLLWIVLGYAGSFIAYGRISCDHCGARLLDWRQQFRIPKKCPRCGNSLE
jgi:hypothetical protein